MSIDWQITSAIVSAIAAVLSIAEMVYRHVQNKKTRRTYYPSQKFQNSKRTNKKKSMMSGILSIAVGILTRDIKKSNVFAVVNKTVRCSERLYKKLLGGEYIHHDDEYFLGIKNAPVDEQIYAR